MTELAETPAASRRRTETPERRRAQLIEATIDVIAAEGLGGATLAAVTRRAGPSAGIVNFHVESEDRLLDAALAFLADERRALWRAAQADPSLPAADKQSAIVRAHFDPGVCNARKLSVWFAFFGEARHREGCRRIAGGRFDAERETIVEALIREFAAEGGYAGVDPPALTKTVESFADGLWLNVLLDPGRLTAAEAEAEARVDDLFVVFPPPPRRARGAGAEPPDARAPPPPAAD
jgi:AcrR family transcriptional regulator